jgi:hypothetical protein
MEVASAGATESDSMRQEFIADVTLQPAHQFPPPTRTRGVWVEAAIADIAEKKAKAVQRRGQQISGVYVHRVIIGRRMTSESAPLVTREASLGRHT